MNKMLKKIEKEMFLSEQNADEIKTVTNININNVFGQIWIKSKQFENLKIDKDWEIGLEVWEGMLRLLIYKDIDVEEPKIINLGKVEEINKSKEKK